MPSYHQLSFFSQIFGFIATIVFALDFYFIFNELATFLKEGGQTDEEPSRQRGNSPNRRVPRKQGSAATLNITKISSDKDQSVLQTLQILSQSVSQSQVSQETHRRSVCVSWVVREVWSLDNLMLWLMDELMQYIRGVYHKAYKQIQ